jgi:ribosomal protein S18 acetylase RimI-like enzyme
MNIRRYVGSDNGIIAGMFDDFLDYLAGIDILGRLRRTEGYGKHQLDTVLGDVDRKEGVFLVAEENGEIVGFVVALMIRQTAAERLEVIPVVPGRITELYVAEGYRGTGIGTALITAAEGYLRDKGCDSVFLEVFSPNTNAYGFYRKLGYLDRTVDLLKKL